MNPTSFAPTSVSTRCPGLAFLAQGARRRNEQRRRTPALEQGDGAGFFAHVDDRVDWIVEGTHPLAGHYKSKSDFVARTFAKLGKVLPYGAQLVVEHYS